MPMIHDSVNKAPVMVSLISNPAAMAPPRSRQGPPPSLKRDSSHLSSPSPQDALHSSQSQSKRLKVAFDDKVDVRIMDDWTSKPLDLVKEEVRSGLDGHGRSGDQKDDSGYEQLRMVFVGAGSSLGPDGQVREADGSALDRPSTALLKKYMVALVGRVSELKTCANLVVAILDMNWIGRDESFVALYVRFLGALGVAVPGYMRAILDRVVRHFIDGKSLQLDKTLTYQKSLLPLGDFARSSVRPVLTRSQCQLLSVGFLVKSRSVDSTWSLVCTTLSDTCYASFPLPAVG